MLTRNALIVLDAFREIVADAGLPMAGRVKGSAVRGSSLGTLLLHNTRSVDAVFRDALDELVAAGVMVTEDDDDEQATYVRLSTAAEFALGGAR